MIILITGQHNVGKTTLAHSVSRSLVLDGRDVLHLDGDVWRSMTFNYKYDEDGRRQNNMKAIRTALALDGPDIVIVMSFIAPYRVMRDLLRGGVDFFLEVYLTSSRTTRTPHRIHASYEEPTRADVMRLTSDAPADVFNNTEAIRTWVRNAIDESLSPDDDKSWLSQNI